MWRVFFKLFMVAACALALGSAARADTTTPDQRMQIASAMEHILLIERDTMLDVERSLINPIWLGTGPGDVRIIPGSRYMDLAEAVGLYIQLRSIVHLEDASPMNAFLYAIMQTLEGLDQAQALKNVLAESAERRQSILDRYGAAIEATRAEFFAAMAERDRGGEPAPPPRNDPYADIPVTGGVGFVSNAGIPGFNRRIETMPLDVCLAECRKEPWCITVDYERAKSKCFLQPVSARSEGLKTDYDGDPYDHYVLMDRLEPL